MMTLPDNPVRCTCGKGYVVDCADGTVSCTNTIAKYEMQHGPWGVACTVRVSQCASSEEAANRAVVRAAAEIGKAMGEM